ncbi:MAG: GGDEF domain-containing protein [Tepidimonas sp.]|nr:GGDEF domain-containing protein [Tepidimonas sp.]
MHRLATFRSDAAESAAAGWSWPLSPQALLALAADWLWEMDAQLRLVRMERVDGAALPAGLEQALGRAPWESPVFEPAARHWRRHRRVLWSHRPFSRLELGWRLPGHPVRWCSISGLPCFDAHGHFLGYVGVAQDITARKRAELALRQSRAQLSELAFHDALTGLPNRRLLMDRLEQVLLRQARAPSWCALLFVDLDDFKGINDRHGHALGDEVLLAVAQRLRSSVRDSDPLGRLAGDEFVALLPDLGLEADAAQRIAQRLAQELLAKLQTPLPDHPAVTISASVGVLMFRGPHELHTLLDQADSLMYRAKADGKGRLTLRWFGRSAPTAAPCPPQS